MQFLVDNPLLCKNMEQYDFEQSQDDDFDALRKEEIALMKQFDKELGEYDCKNLLGQKRPPESNLADLVSEQG